MASIFWNSQGVIMIDYLEQGRKINGAYYAGELRQLHLLLEDACRHNQASYNC